MDSQGEWPVCRELDRNIELISGSVSEWYLLVLNFPCVCDPLVSRVTVDSAAAAAAAAASAAANMIL